MVAQVPQSRHRMYGTRYSIVDGGLFELSDQFARPQRSCFYHLNLGTKDAHGLLISSDICAASCPLHVIARLSPMYVVLTNAQLPNCGPGSRDSKACKLCDQFENHKARICGAFYFWLRDFFEQGPRVSGWLAEVIPFRAILTHFYSFPFPFPFPSSSSFYFFHPRERKGKRNSMPKKGSVKRKRILTYKTVESNSCSPWGRQRHSGFHTGVRSATVYLYRSENPPGASVCRNMDLP